MPSLRGNPGIKRASERAAPHRDLTSGYGLWAVEERATGRFNGCIGWDARAAFDAHWKKILANPRITSRTILFEGQLAGHIASFVIGGHREITYGIARHLWGRGLAKSGFEITGEDSGFANARGQEIEEVVLRLS